jgi:hypothetical protein
VATLADFGYFKEFRTLEDTILLFERNRTHTGIQSAAIVDGSFCTGVRPAATQPAIQWLIFDRETFSAFGPAAFDQRATALGRHAFEKSMGPCPFDSTGLIGAFHCLQPFNFIVGVSRK